MDLVKSKSMDAIRYAFWPCWMIFSFVLGYTSLSSPSWHIRKFNHQFYQQTFNYIKIWKHCSLFPYLLLSLIFPICLDQENLLFLNCRSLASVSYAAVDFFRPSAQRLIEEKGAVDALAAALAHISGASSFEPRSLITSDKVEICEKIVCGWERLKLNHRYLSGEKYRTSLLCTVLC